MAKSSEAVRADHRRKEFLKSTGHATEMRVGLSSRSSVQLGAIPDQCLARSVPPDRGRFDTIETQQRKTPEFVIEVMTAERDVS